MNGGIVPGGIITYSGEFISDNDLDTMFDQAEAEARASVVAIVPVNAPWEVAMPAAKRLERDGWAVDPVLPLEDRGASWVWEFWLASGDGHGFGEAVAQAIQAAWDNLNNTGSANIVKLPVTV